MFFLKKLLTLLRTNLSSLKSSMLNLIRKLHVYSSTFFAKILLLFPLNDQTKSALVEGFNNHPLKDTRSHSPMKLAYPVAPGVTDMRYSSFALDKFMQRILSLRYFYAITNYVRDLLWQTCGFAYQYKQGVVFLLFIDACLTDDEPLWEPIEWSLVQTWILFIFLFGWIGENLIVSRYGSYTGRDKRVWMSWFKTFWLLEIYYILNFLIVASFVITPFYFETNYSLPLVYSWWNWYSRAFFLQFTFVFTIVLGLAHAAQLSVRWVNWKKTLLVVTLINFFLGYLLYTHFIMSFFGYFTNPLWYQKVKPVDYIQLSHEPSKWGWGVAKRDHFTYHQSKTVFWFKNDGPFASAFLLFHLYIFLSLFFVYIYWIALFRRIFSTKEVPLTYLTYCVSALKQLFYCFLFLYAFVFLSFLTEYWRLPIEFSSSLSNQSWSVNFFEIALDYPSFIISIIMP